MGEPPKSGCSPEVQKMGKDNHGSWQGPRMLPILRLPEAGYFIDLQLGQFRDIEDPGNYIGFETEEGRRMCQQANVLSCSKCGAHIIVSSRLRTDWLNCVRCMTPLELEAD